MKKIGYKSHYNREKYIAYGELVSYPSLSCSMYFDERKKCFFSCFLKLKKKKSGVSVLDVGSGTGKHIFSLRSLGRSSDYFLGVEINKKQVDFCNYYAKKNNIYNIDFLNLDISVEDSFNKINKKFDLIIFSEVIEHLYPKDQLFILNKLSNYLNPNGILIITCPNSNNLIKKVLKMFKVRLVGTPGHVAELSYSQLKKISSIYFKILKRGAFCFSYGNVLFDKNVFGLLFFDVLNRFFRTFFPSKCFDQYIILTKK